MLRLYEIISGVRKFCPETGQGGKASQREPQNHVELEKVLIQEANYIGNYLGNIKDKQSLFPKILKEDRMYWEKWQALLVDLDCHQADYNAAIKSKDKETGTETAKIMKPLVAREKNLENMLLK